MENLNEQLLEFARTGNLDEVKRLVKLGANIDAKDCYGYTALRLASDRIISEIVKFLVESGANIDVKDRRGDTALMVASCQGNLEVVEFLKNINNK